MKKWSVCLQFQIILTADELKELSRDVEEELSAAKYTKVLLKKLRQRMASRSSSKSQTQTCRCLLQIFMKLEVAFLPYTLQSLKSHTPKIYRKFTDELIVKTTVLHQVFLQKLRHRMARSSSKSQTCRHTLATNFHEIGGGFFTTYITKSKISNSENLLTSSS